MSDKDVKKLETINKKIRRLERLVKDTKQDIAEMEEFEDEDEAEELAELQTELVKHKEQLKALETEKAALLRAANKASIKKTDTYIDEVKGQIDTAAKKEALLNTKKEIKKTDTYIDEVKGQIDHSAIKASYKKNTEKKDIKKTDTYIDEVKGQIDHSAIKASYKKNLEKKDIKKTDTYIDEVKGQIDTAAKKKALFEKKSFKKTTVDAKGNAKKFAALFEAGGNKKKQTKAKDSYFSDTGGADAKSLRSKFEFMAQSSEPEGQKKKSTRRRFSTQVKRKDKGPRKSVFGAFEAESVAKKAAAPPKVEKIAKKKTEAKKTDAKKDASAAVDTSSNSGLSERRLLKKEKRLAGDKKFAETQISKYEEFVTMLKDSKARLVAKLDKCTNDEKELRARIAAASGSPAAEEEAEEAAPADVSFDGKIILLPGGYAVEKGSYNIGDKYDGKTITAIIIPQTA